MTNQKPTIAILGGTGKEGPGLALRWARAGYPILIGSRQEEKAQATAQQIHEQLSLLPAGKAPTGPVSGLENCAAAARAEISVLTVVQAAHETALESVKEALQGKILIDATARVDFRDPRPPSPPSAGRRAQEILGGGVRVVAAFQNVPSHALRANLDQPLASDVLVCADDVQAAEVVISLANDGGMRAYYAGSLDNALVVEGLTALLISINKHYSIKNASISVSGITLQ